MRPSSALVSGILLGIGFSVGLLGSVLLAATLQGSIKTNFNAGELISASELNANFQAINDTLVGLPECSNSNSARVLLNAGQNVSSGTDWIFTFDSEQFDTNNLYDPANPNQLTVQQSGMYLIHGRIEYSSNTTGVRYARIYQNGGTIADTTRAPDTLGNTFVSISTIRSFNAGDTIQFGGRQESGGNLTTVIQEFFVSRLCGP